MQCDKYPYANGWRSHVGGGGQNDSPGRVWEGFTADLSGVERMNRLGRREESGSGVGNTECGGGMFVRGEGARSFLITK